MSRADTQFSKVRLEMLCDGIICLQPTTFAGAIAVVFMAPRQALFAAAMTQVTIGLSTRRLAARR